MLRLSLHPDGMAPRIANLPEWRAHLLARLHHQAEATGDARLAELHDELAAYPGGQAEPASRRPPGPTSWSRSATAADGRELSFLSHHRDGRHADGRHRLRAGHRVVLPGRRADRRRPRGRMMDRLDTRQLNRATLDRQLLLRRAARPARAAIEHLAGLQAQAPLAPYVGLWTRLAGFGHDDLEDLSMERIVVRAHLMRNTVHLVTAADFVRFRPLFQLRIERDLSGHFGRNLGDLDLAELRAVAAVLLAETPLTRGQLGERLSARWPDHDPASLAYAATHLLQLVQVPPRGLWGRRGQASWFLASAWLDGLTPAARDADTALEQLVLRYLAAYGPGHRPRHPGLVRACPGCAR